MQVPKTVRRLTDPLLGALRIPIMSGVNRGRWWSVISAGGGYGSGRRSSAQMRLLSRLVREGDVVWDVGAHQGFVTLFAARGVGRSGHVHAFEPSALNRRLLTRHVRWNGLANVHVHPFALSDHDGTAHFGGTGTSRMFALGGGTEVVEVRAAESIVGQGIAPAPTFVKIDVEGAEAETVDGLLSVLPRTARLLIAMHARDADQRCAARLADAGFTLVPSRDLEASRRGDWRSDPDLFAYGPAASSGAADAALLRSQGF